MSAEAAEILPMRTPHLADVARLQAGAYRDARLIEPPYVHASRLALAAPYCFVAAAGGEVAGYIVAHPFPSGSWPGLNQALEAIPERADAVHIHDIAVSPAHKGKRLAPRLVSATLEAARQGELAWATLVAVDGAHTFWERLGFVAAPEPRPPYGEDAWFMRRAL